MDNSNTAEKSRIATYQTEISSPAHLAFKFVLMRSADQSDRYHACPFDGWRILCNIFWHAKLSLYHHNTHLPRGGEFRRGACLAHRATGFFGRRKSPNVAAVTHQMKDGMKERTNGW